MSSKAPTLKDIAQRAKVSTATASAILGGTKSNSRFGADTRERVIAVSQELGYQANAVARSLRRQRSQLIGLYIGYLDDNLGGAFASAVITGAHRACRMHDHDLVLFTGHHDRDPQLVFKSLNNGSVDGLILVAPTEDPLSDMIADSRVKAVAISNIARSIPSVVVDDSAGGKIQAAYLYGQGHRRVIYRVAHISGSSVRRRYEAFHLEAKRLGMEVFDAMNSDRELNKIDWHFLNQSPKPTAIVAWDDSAAHFAIEALSKHGFRTPADIAIMGFNHFAYEGAAPPAYRLTTIAAPWTRVAESAIEILMGLIQGQLTPSETVFPVELVQGDTA